MVLIIHQPLEHLFGASVLDLLRRRAVIHGVHHISLVHHRRTGDDARAAVIVEARPQ
jgi:hypothetical protein